MAILTESGRVAVARYIAAQPLHMAWGEGAGSWDDEAVPVQPSGSSLIVEVGRLQATTVQFVQPDPVGAIELPEGNFSISGAPTKYLMVKFDFDYSHAIGSVIRELGVFVGTVAEEDVPPGTKYLTTAQVADPGMMLVTERVGKFTRASNIRQKFTYVIQF